MRTGFITHISEATDLKSGKPQIRAKSSEEVFEEKFNKRKLQTLVEYASAAYRNDGFFRHAIDKHAELFSDFSLKGKNEAAIKYLEDRLTEMSLVSSEHWKTTLSRVVTEYFKVGTAFICKIRGKSSVKKALTRPHYKGVKNPVISLLVMPPTSMDDLLDPKAGVVWVGPKVEKDRMKESTFISKNGFKVDMATVSDELATKMARSKKEDFYIPGQDILVLTYKRPPGYQWGLGVGFPAIEDVALLRTIEQVTGTMIKKNIFPKLHHEISVVGDVGNNLRDIVQKTYNMWLHSPPDGVIVTGPGHKITSIGAESQALRVGEYLTHFTKRCFSSLGISPFLMGYEAATIGTAQAAKQLLLSKIRYCQKDIARNIEMFLFNEILWEGGYDPYDNEKDAVFLEFEEVDIETKIKVENHLADLYTKYIVGFQEAREEMGRDPKIPEGSLYLKRVRLPEIEAQAKAKAAANPKLPPRREVESTLATYGFEDNQSVLDAISDLDTKYGTELYEDRTFLDQVERLLGDEEAIVELIFNQLRENHDAEEEQKT